MRLFIFMKFGTIYITKKDAKQFKTIFASFIVAEAGLEHATSRL